MERKYFVIWIAVAIFFVSIMISYATAVPFAYSVAFQTQTNDLVSSSEKKILQQACKRIKDNYEKLNVQMRDLFEKINKVDFENENITKLFFYLSGLLILLMWLNLLKVKNVRAFPFYFVFFLNAGWQVFGHKNGFLPTDNLEPFIPESFYFIVFLIIGYTFIFEYYFLHNSRAAVLLVILYHVWWGLGYYMGFNNDIIPVKSRYNN